MPVDERLYPVNLVLRGRRCLVVGGGHIAARKVSGLVEAGADVHVVALWICDPLRAMAADPASSVTLEEREYRSTDLPGSWLVITATDKAAVNASVRADADAARIWVNAADDPPSCSFTLPAVARQGSVMVTISTSGQSPALAAWLKAEAEKRMGPELATLANLLGEARAELQAAGRSTEAVDWRPALNSDMLEEIRVGDLVRARKRLEACLSSSLD